MYPARTRSIASTHSLTLRTPRTGGRLRVAGLLACALGPLADEPVRAQAPAQSAAEYVFEVQSRARWMHGGQQARSTPHLRLEDWIHVDSVRAEPAGGRTLHLSLGRGARRDAGVLRVDAAGQATAMRITPPRPRQGPFRDSAERLARDRLFADARAGHVRLPEARLLPVVPAFRAASPAVGAQWTDTVAFTAVRDAFRQVIEGRRLSVVVGDTMIDGRRLWIVRDSAHVTYRERWLREERTLDTLSVVERSAAGVIRGRSLYDAQLRLYRVRTDTTGLSGTAALHYPDGRTFRTPARYDRVRRIDLHDAERYAARRAELEAEWRRLSTGGMLILPATPLEERLAARDTTARDSLLGVLRTTGDADERRTVRVLLERFAGWDPALDGRIRDAARADEDTAVAIQSLARAFYDREPFDEATVQRALPYLADPGLVFAAGARSDPLYENPRQALLLAPPAATPDTADWPCTPAACRLLAAQRDAAGDARLRSLALIAAFALEPARFAAEVEERARSGDRFVEPAAAMAHGTLVQWPMTDVRAPLPAAQADWRAWLAWMDPRPAGLGSGAPPPQPRFDELHAATLRIQELVMGRDIARELRARRDEADADSARLVYGVILTGLQDHGGEAEPPADPAAIAARLRAGSEADAALARRELGRLFQGAQAWHGPEADSLVDRLLAVLIEGAEPWPDLVPHPGGLRLHRVSTAGHRPEDGPVFLLHDSLGAAVAAAWQGRATMVTAAEWEARSNRLPGILFQARPVQRAGPFARVRADYESRYGRPQDQAPAGFAGGFDVILLRTETGWAVASLSAWVT